MYDSSNLFTQQRFVLIDSILQQKAVVWFTGFCTNKIYAKKVLRIYNLETPRKHSVIHALFDFDLTSDESGFRFRKRGSSGRVCCSRRSESRQVYA